MTTPFKTVQEQVVYGLMRVKNSKAFATRVLDTLLERSVLAPRERALFTELFYGTLRQQHQLDTVLASLTHGRSLTQLPQAVLWTLRLGAYQLLHTRMPHHAAVATVLAAVGSPFYGLKPLMNAVLRALARSTLPLPIAQDCPDWLTPALVAEIKQRRGDHAYQAWLNAMQHQAPVCLRVNRLQTTAKQLQQCLTQAGITSSVIAVPHNLSTEPCSLAVQRPGKISALPGFAEGWFTVQDPAATAVGFLAAPKKDSIWLDLCAAPGGKATHLAELQEDQGQVIAVDIHPRKVLGINHQQQRLKLKSITATVGDMRDSLALKAILARYQHRVVDGVLVDAPCSGLGTHRRHPEQRPPSIEKLQQLIACQQALLHTAAQVICPGGSLVYAVCTVTAAEGPEQIAAFLRQQPNFTLADLSRDTLELWTDRNVCDSFYAVRLERQR